MRLAQSLDEVLITGWFTSKDAIRIGVCANNGFRSSLTYGSNDWRNNHEVNIRYRRIIFKKITLNY